MKLKAGQKVKVKCLDKMSVSEMRVTIGKTGIISDICDDFDNAVNKYETENNVNFSNFWCFVCADKTIKKIERTVE
jgi:hypothetical protein